MTNLNKTGWIKSSSFKVGDKIEVPVKLIPSEWKDKPIKITRAGLAILVIASAD